MTDQKITSLAARVREEIPVDDELTPHRVATAFRSLGVETDDKQVLDVLNLLTSDDSFQLSIELDNVIARYDAIGEALDKVEEIPLPSRSDTNRRRNSAAAEQGRRLLALAHQADHLRLALLDEYHKVRRL